MNNKIFIGLVVIAAGILAGWYVFGGSASNAPVDESMIITPTPAGSNLGIPGEAEGEGTGMEKGGVAARTVVTLTRTGFSPVTVNVKLGTVVTFVNEQDAQMWIASDPHPTHSILPGLDQRMSVGKGGTYEYTFAKVGTWGYHNHENPTQKGSVTVSE